MNSKVTSAQEKATKANVADQTVSAFMTKQVLAAHIGDSIRATIHLFYKNQISGAPVLDKNEILKGVVSEHDLLIQAATKDLDSPIEFTTNVTSVKVDAKLKDLIVIFYKHKMKRLPVVGAGGHVVGIVSRIDLLAQLALSES